MNAIKLAILTCLTTVGAALQAHAAMSVIYVVPGVVDSGGGNNTGVATVFHCSNPTSNSKDVNVSVYDSAGTLAGSATVAVGGKGTATFATKLTTVFREDANLATGTVRQGRAHISAQSDKVFCSVVVVDAANLAAGFLSSLHMIRIDGPEE